MAICKLVGRLIGALMMKRILTPKSGSEVVTSARTDDGHLKTIRILYSATPYESFKMKRIAKETLISARRKKALDRVG